MSTDAPPPNELPNDVATLQAMIVQERNHFQQHRASFQQERAALHEARVQLQGMTAAQTATIEQQQRTIAQLEHRLAQLLRRQYGPQRERLDPDQLMLFSEEELETLVREAQDEAASDEASEETSDDDRAAPRRKKRPGRRPLPEHLPRTQVVHELSPEERACPCCGEQRSEIGSETSEQLEIVPAKFFVIEHVRVKYACRHCEEHVAIAPKPPQPIDKGLPGPGLLAYVTLGKYGDHMPLYRLEEMSARHGVSLRRGTLCQWVAAAADLAAPLVKRMRELLVTQSRIIATDDTTVKLLDGLIGKARTARFWAYLGDKRHPHIVFDFTDSRRRDGPAKFLAGYAGYLQADAFSGYDAIYHDSQGKILEVACWAHCRRYWWEARDADPQRAHGALSYLGRLYQIEQAMAEKSPEEKLAARREHALPILAAMRAWLDTFEEGRLLPKSPLTKAYQYTRNQWEALVRYTENGELAIDNNASERMMKIPAIGRKNWLFVASQTGGQRAAILFSLVASCKANQVEPWAYLNDVFSRLPSIPPENTEQLDRLLPNRWLEEHPQHRWKIDAIRKQERQAKQKKHGKPMRKR